MKEYKRKSTSTANFLLYPFILQLFGMAFHRSQGGSAVVLASATEDDNCSSYVSVGDKQVGVDAFEDITCRVRNENSLGCHEPPNSSLHCRHCKTFSTNASNHLYDCPQKQGNNIPVESSDETEDVAHQVVEEEIMPRNNPSVNDQYDPDDRSPRIYEATDTTHSRWYYGKALNRHSGHSGNNYLDFSGEGAWIEWHDIEITHPGKYEIAFRYACKSTRPAELLIDGNYIKILQFSATLSWSWWATETNEIHLDIGKHSFMIMASVSGSSGPNIDWMSIKPSSSNQWNNDDHYHNINNNPTPPGKNNNNNPPDNENDNDDNDNNNGGGGDDRPSISFEKVVVIASGKSLSRRNYVSSPSQTYEVGLNGSGDLVMKDNDGDIVWRLGISGGNKCYMQPDGNMVIKDASNDILWVSYTSENRGAQLIVDDGGRIAVENNGVPLWLDGIPRGQLYNNNRPSDDDDDLLEYPIRAAFYYAWYPETWTVNGKRVHFEPQLGYYSSGDPMVAISHVDQLDYARVDLGIISWWGIDSRLDRARITLLMDETIELGSNLKWTGYHEDERHEDASPRQIRKDLDYLSKWFTWHEAWGYKDGKPIIFVYNEGGCDVSERWMEASNNEWYVVLKVFTGYKDCDVQPDSWHQYGVSNGAIDLKGVSFSISPGFWRADRNQPSLPRIDKETWRDNVRSMVESGIDTPWHLIITFNEAGEGTMIEASDHWSSNSGYGYYLDALHDIY